MIASITVILLCQLVGEVLARGLRTPIPGPVIGMALMLAVLAAKRRFRAKEGALEATCQGLLANLSLMFVPAGVGVVQRLDIFAAYGVGLALTLFLSTMAALLVAAIAFVLVARAVGEGEAP